MGTRSERYVRPHHDMRVVISAIEVGSNLALVSTMASQILVVDDDDDAREGLVEALSEEFRTVVGAENGQDALDMIREGGFCPDLIILDLRMPVMDGVAFLQHRALDPSLGSTPVIVLTSEASILPYLAETVTAVLPKPVPLTRLVEIIRAVSDAPGRQLERMRSMKQALRRDAGPPHGIERRRHGVATR